MGNPYLLALEVAHHDVRDRDRLYEARDCLARIVWRQTTRRPKRNDFAQIEGVGERDRDEVTENGGQVEGHERSGGHADEPNPNNVLSDVHTSVVKKVEAAGTGFGHSKVYPDDLGEDLGGGGRAVKCICSVMLRLLE
eukprot:2702047-Prymnesium_polylepis.1